MSDELMYEVDDDGILTITLNRPGVLNALSGQLKVDLRRAFAQAQSDSGVRAVLLRGAGERAFSAGQDLGESVEFHTAEQAADWIEEHHLLYSELRGFSKPFVAAIDGYCVGAGWQVALLADVRFCSEHALFIMTEISVGIPCITGSGLLWPIVGAAKTAEIVLSGRRYSAQEAERLGLVTAVFAREHLYEEARFQAKKMADFPTKPFASTKTWLTMLTQSIYEQSMHYAMRGHGEAYESGVPQEKMKRFTRGGTQGGR